MTDSDITTVQAGFAAVAAGDLDGFRAMFTADATWDHRNGDRFAGVHKGPDAIVAFVTESVQLSGGTLSPVPQRVMGDGDGHVAVLTRLTAARPDGRTLDDVQVLVFSLRDGQVESVDQFVGDPASVTAFWA